MNDSDIKARERRDFLRKLGLGALLSGAALAGCEDSQEASASARPVRGQMSYRENPKTGEKVSILGYGCMRWPTLGGGSGRDSADELDQEAINALVDAALAGGVNYFDTSPAYCKGMSERATGIALARHPRESYFIATKLSNFARETWPREKSIEMYHRSFAELQTDYIDYMLLHAVGMGDGMQEFESRYIDNGMLDFLLAEREAGRIRNLGFSYHGDVRVFDRLLAEHEHYRWDFVQIQMNYLDWQHAKEINPRNTNAEYLYQELERRGIPVVIMEPLLGGRLAKVPDHIATRLKQREPERSVASWAFRFAGTHPGVLTVLSGMTYREHLDDNLHSFSPLKALSKEELSFLYDTADLMMQYPTIPCNDCKYCMPCPYGLDIPATLLHYNKCVNESNVISDCSAEGYATARRAFLIGYDRSVPRLRQADHCIGCGKCMHHCPQGIDIPKQMQRLTRYAEHLRAGTSPVEELAALLHRGNHSLVLARGSNIRCFDGRGVSDLYHLLQEEPQALRSASLADKVVGKGAAALMILGGVREVYADVICEDAVSLLARHGVYTTWGSRVPAISNRNHTGLCPVEECCKDCRTAEECLPKIRAFLMESN